MFGFRSGEVFSNGVLDQDSDLDAGPGSQEKGADLPRCPEKVTQFGLFAEWLLSSSSG